MSWSGLRKHNKLGINALSTCSYRDAKLFSITVQRYRKTLCSFLVLIRKLGKLGGMSQHAKLRKTLPRHFNVIDSSIISVTTLNVIYRNQKLLRIGVYPSYYLLAFSINATMCISYTLPGACKSTSTNMKGNYCLPKHLEGEKKKKKKVA